MSDHLLRVRSFEGRLVEQIRRDKRSRRIALVFWIEAAREMTCPAFGNDSQGRSIVFHF
jgi:hypothetical protein